jgi:hypothetical protein
MTEYSHLNTHHDNKNSYLASLVSYRLFHLLGFPNLRSKHCSDTSCGDPAHHTICSVQVFDIIFTEVPFRKYHIPQSGTTETLRVRNFTCS